MISARLLLIALLPFAALTTHAQSNVISQSESSIRPDYSSEHNRAGKKFVAALQLVGGSTLTGSGQGVIAGYQADRNTVLQVEFSKGSSKTGDKETDGINEREGTTVGAYAKRFMSNSFYAKGGVEYTKVKYDNDYLWNFASTTTDAYGFEANVISAALVIGNQWQWENFTLGCDWIGLSLPMSHEVTSEYSDSYALAKKYNKEDQETLLENASATVLRFYVGATF